MRNSSRSLIALLIVPSAVAGCAGGSAGLGSTSAPSTDEVVWGSCEDLVTEVAGFYDLMQAASPLDGWEDRMQCGWLSVPLDYDRLDGREITLAVSRLLPETASVGTVLTNPGGPGVEGRTMPALLAASGMGDLASDRTLIGVDVRGTGGSTNLECTGLLDMQAPEGTVDEEVALAYSRAIAAANADCVSSDPDFIAQLTTQNAARDLDRVRAAIGAEQVDYFGASWGTELGVAYLTQFTDHVGRMLLDSVTDLRQDAEPSLDDIAASVAALAGAEQEDPDGLTASDSYSPVNITARTAMTCNAYTGADGPAEVWRAHVARVEQLGLDAQDRIPSVLSGELPGTSVCAGWPITPQPLDLTTAGMHDNLQLVAHADEDVTPAAWSRTAHDLLGGNLTILDDSDHGSLAGSTAASAAVDFLRTAAPMP